MKNKVTKKKKEVTIDDLAIMIGKGFKGVDHRFDKVENRLDKVENRMEKMEGRMFSLENGQEEIKLRLDNVAYRFELIELQHRVEILEQKIAKKRS